MPPSATFGPGAGFLPFWLGVLLAVLAMILFVSAWRRQATEKDSAIPSSRGSRRCSQLRWSWWVLRSISSSSRSLGYLVDTFLFVVFLVKVVEREKWPLTLMIAVADDGRALHHLSRSC